MRILLGLILLLFSTPAFADINYQVYAAGGATPCKGCGTALNSGTTASINFDWGSGVVMGSGRSDGVSIHFTGYITVPGSASSSITFYNRSDDGFYMTINNTLVINNWREQGPANYNSSGAITLQGGQTYIIDVWYYENGGGAVAQLYWNQSGSIALVPTSAYTTTMPNPKAFGDSGASLPATAISSAKSVKISQNLSLTHNSVYIQNSGNNTTVTVAQHGYYNGIRGINGSQYATISGTGNTLSSSQGTITVSGLHNLQEISITGNGNTVAAVQQSSNNYAEIIVNGTGNSISTTQTGTVGKSQFINVTGSSNSITTNQQGNAAHFLELTVPTNANTISITQAGNAQKIFSLTINSPSIGVTVVQDNATVSDSAAMAITCTISPCSGYTYTRH
jgi:hypothetical protein